MDYTCANCKNRRAWDCEDYNWGYLDTKRCDYRFELDVSTLSKKEQETILAIARAIKKEGERE